MALFFIALIGLGLFALFLMALAQVTSHTLVAVLKWTSITILGVAFGLFLVSGRILYATVLVVIVGLMMRSHHKKKGKVSPLFLSPPADKDSSSKKSKGPQ